MKKLWLTVSLILVGVIGLTVGLIAVFSGGSAHTLTFQTEGGEAIPAVEVQVGEDYTLPQPSRVGYSFEGWYLTADFSGSPVTTVTLEADTTVYARWEKLGVITLDLDGGSLSEGSTLYLKNGEVILDFMQSYVPQKNGFVFGAWFVGGDELGRDRRMDGEITLKAGYKVGYTVEIYTQNATLDGYEQTGTVQEYGYPGTTAQPSPEVTGFERVEHADQIASAELSETAADNLFRLYYDRQTFQVVFVPGYPDGDSGQSRILTGRYGIAMELPYDLTCEGYVLRGWAASSNGEVEYELNYLDSLVFNGEGESWTPPVFTPTGSTALYAVWSRGYTDMFGGEDVLYLPDEGGSSIYLCRGGVYFRGEYVASGRQFEFMLDSGDSLLSGRLNEDGTFAYYSDSRSGQIYSLYTVGEGIDENTTLAFDAYNGVSYRVAGQDEGIWEINTTGTYTVDENGVYNITFGSGSYAGQTMAVRTGTAAVGSDNRPIFMIRNEADVALGTLVRCISISAEGTRYYPEVYSVTFDGFGTALYNSYASSGIQTVEYLYVWDEEGTRFTLRSGTGTTAFVGQYIGSITTSDGSQTGSYMVYNADYDVTYTAADGSTLTLDGLYTAVFTPAGGAAETGVFSVGTSSVFGGSIVTFTGASGERTFIVDSETVQDGENQSLVHTFAERPAGYAEFYYRDSGSTTPQAAPLIVINDEQPGTASIYGYNSNTSAFVRLSSGTFEYDAASGQYRYTRETVYEGEVTLPTELDIPSIRSIVFNIGTASYMGYAFDVTYWYSVVLVTEDGTDADVSYSEVYTGENGSTLILAAGYATLSVNGNVFTGAYSAYATGSSVLVITLSNGSVYAEIDGDDMSFVLLNTPPYTARAILADGSISSDVQMAFDGKGGAVYTDAEGTEHAGSVTSEGSTAFGYAVYRFTSSDGALSFTFVQPATSSAIYFARYNDSLGSGVYFSDDGSLELDGYGFGARYTDVAGHEYTGMYFLTSDDVSEALGGSLLVFYASDGTSFYFDYKNGTLTEFSVRGAEFGTYLQLDNQSAEGLYFALDGYGGLSVFTVSRDEAGSLVYHYLDEEGSYTADGEGAFVLRYRQDAATEVTLTGTTGVYTGSSSSIPVFTVLYEEYVTTFVNTEDWSVLVLDGYGNVTCYDPNGNTEGGSYTIITDTLLYFVNEGATDASLYTYDKQTASMAPVSLQAMGYYTSTLESLLFSEYGFAVFNGETRYYYYVEADGSVVIYLQDPSSEEANAYGFVEDRESIPALGDTIVYDGQTYYSNGGFALSFGRAEETRDSYPVLLYTNDDGSEHKAPLGNLSFTPSGASEFRVSGRVNIDGTDYNCTVVRAALAEGGYEMYVSIPLNNGSYYRFDITVNYTGGGTTENPYEVTAMRHVFELPSDYYLTMYYMMYMFMGSSALGFPNSWGVITMITEYDAEGTGGTPVLNGSFEVNSGMYGTDGQLISLEGAAYEYVGNSLYSAAFTGADGNDYTLYFAVSQNRYFGMYAYQLVALVRTQTLTDQTSGLTVTVGRIIASDYYSAGSLYSIRLSDGSGVIEADLTGYLNNRLYYIVRETDGETGRYTGATFYRVDLTEQTDLVENENVIPLYASVTVTAETVTTFYTEDGGTYVDIDADNNVRLITIGSTTYSVAESSFDGQTQTYTATTPAGTTYTIVLENGVVTVTEQAAEEEGEDVAAA